MKEHAENYKPAEKLDLKDIKNELPKVFSKVHCPSCNEPVVADNLSLQNNVAKCSGCNVIFSIGEEIKSVNASTEIKQDIFRPEGIELFHFRDDLDITVNGQLMHWFDGLGIVLFFGIALFSTLFYFTDVPISPFIPIMSTIGLFYFLYKISDFAKSKTYIDVNNKYLSIKYRPKNFRKDKTYKVDEIDQLYIKNVGGYAIYLVINDLEGQKHEKLIAVKSISKAKYLEQEIERYLNIENRVVPEANV